MNVFNFGQATAIPNNGASNAADFQPTTRNPQSEQGNLPTGTGPQSTTSGDVLNNPNVQLSVPVASNPQAVPELSQPANGGINWFLVVAVTVVLVVVAESFLRKREQQNSSASRSNRQIVDNQPAILETSQTKKPTVGRPKPKSKKSRAKRKRG